MVNRSVTVSTRWRRSVCTITLPVLRSSSAYSLIKVGLVSGSTNSTLMWEFASARRRARLATWLYSRP